MLTGNECIAHAHQRTVTHTRHDYDYLLCLLLLSFGFLVLALECPLPPDAALTWCCDDSEEAASESRAQGAYTQLRPRIHSPPRTSS